jgi:hypothetical protein
MDQNRHTLRQFISTEIQIPEKKTPTRAPSPSIRSGDDAARDKARLSETNVVTLEDQFKEEVSLFLHRGTPTNLARRTGAGVAVDEKKGEKEEKVALVRLPTCAIFHKSSASKGAPHTFYHFLRQWPSVSRIIVGIILITRQDIADP